MLSLAERPLEEAGAMVRVVVGRERGGGEAACDGNDYMIER